MHGTVVRTLIATVALGIIVTAPFGALIQRSADHDDRIKHLHEDHGGHGHVTPDSDEQFRTDLSWDSPGGDSAGGLYRGTNPAAHRIGGLRLWRPAGRDPPSHTLARAPPLP